MGVDENNVVRIIRLEADSPRRAWYQLRIVRLGSEGYVIEKSSGSSGGKPVVEAYFRKTLEEAEAKFTRLVEAKTRQQRPRCYQMVKQDTDECQLPLFG
jgi:phenylacetate-coenzyme A ligase PaaK-like adenylate-forming protein